jgi:Beta-glucosidase (SUN family)
MKQCLSQLTLRTGLSLLYQAQTIGVALQLSKSLLRFTLCLAALTMISYYINPPGTGCDEACVWGSKDSPVGNWSPYVAGANVDHSGQTFIKLGWNPIYLEPATPFKDKMPNWGVRVECDGDGCNGLPCAIDPAKNKVNEMIGSSSNGAGGGAFCVVTVPKGVSANFVVFDGSGGSGHGGGGNGKDNAGPKGSAPTSTPSSSAAPTSTYAASSSSSSWSASSSVGSSTSVEYDGSSSSPAPTPMYSPHEFVENANSTYTAKSASVKPSSSQTSPISPATTGGASTAQLSIASLLMSSLIVFMTLAFSG